MGTTPPGRPDNAASPARRLGATEAAVFETFVVPRYLAMFGERMLDMLVAGPEARVCHVQCRTGYPDPLLGAKLPNAHVHGCDPSEHAIELARAKARTTPGLVMDYRVAPALPLPFPAGAFSHAYTLHPAPLERAPLLDELARLVAPRGQALVGIPLRGSFVEILDLLREYALKNELGELTNAVEAAALVRPTDDMIARELERAGFEFVDVDLRVRTMRFSTGREFFEDPAARIMILPELRASLFGSAQPPDEAAPHLLEAPFAYVRDAIDKYWSDGAFELTVNVGVASGRRK